MELTEISNVLRQSAELINAHGLAKGVYSTYNDDGTTCFCAMGAIRYVCDYNHFKYNRVFVAFRPYLPAGFHGRIATWNDCNDKEQVVGLMRRAADEIMAA